MLTFHPGLDIWGEDKGLQGEARFSLKSQKVKVQREEFKRQEESVGIGRV